MSWQDIGYPDPSCACNCAAVATLNLLVFKTCSGAHAPLTGLAVNMVQGATTVSGTTDGTGHATFSLPSTGIWAVRFPSPPSGYRDGTEGGLQVTVAAGANSATVSPHVDWPNTWMCQSSDCDDPVQGPLHVSGSINAGGNTYPVSQTTQLGGAVTESGLYNRVESTGIFLLGHRPGDGVALYCVIYNLPAAMKIDISTDPGMAFPTSLPEPAPASHTCGGAYVYTLSPPTATGFAGTVSP